MVGWHHQLNGHEFEQTLGVGEGQGSLLSAVHGVINSQTQLSNWTIQYLIISDIEHLFHVPAAYLDFVFGKNVYFLCPF